MIETVSGIYRIYCPECHFPDVKLKPLGYVKGNKCSLIYCTGCGREFEVEMVFDADRPESVRVDLKIRDTGIRAFS